MIKALIIEDEKLAAEHLQNIIGQSNHDIEIIKVIDSIEQSIHWFRLNPNPDLIFLDIQLSDGLSFEIFNHVLVSCPVIFTTAYEEYAIRAFKVNSVDYLLKPVRIEDLISALDKLKSWGDNFTEQNEPALKFKIDQMMQMLTNSYKRRFVVNAGPHLRSVETEKIQCFYSLEKSTFLMEENGKAFDINYSLEQLEKLLDPQLFFRISRKYIVNIKAIKDMIVISSSRLKLKISGSSDDDILVSQGRLKEFKNWLER
jgi:DNA-binding LytR/AlgR family response regulator